MSTDVATPELQQVLRALESAQGTLHDLGDRINALDNDFSGSEDDTDRKELFKKFRAAYQQLSDLVAAAKGLGVTEEYEALRLAEKELLP